MFMRILTLLAAVLVLPALATTADAKPKKRSASSVGYYGDYGYVMEPSASRRASRGEGRSERRSARRHAARSEGRRSGRSGRSYRSEERMSLGYSTASTSRSSYSGGVGPRPAKWCGWWMRTQRGGGPEMNVAWNWRKYGSPASPQVGAVVVWRHHVGQIVGQAANGMWIVQSGNDGGRVRSRPRSISGAVIRI